MSFNGFKLAAFADESDNKFVGQLDALLRNGLDALEMRNVDGKKNVVIDSNGSKFICHGKMTPFSTFNSENITFKNMTVDYADPTVVEMEVLEINHVSYV